MKIDIFTVYLIIMDIVLLIAAYLTFEYYGLWRDKMAKKILKYSEKNSKKKTLIGVIPIFIDIDKLLQVNNFESNKGEQHSEDYDEQIIGYLECLYDVRLISKTKWEALYSLYLERDIREIYISFDEYNEYSEEFIKEWWVWYLQ